MEEITKGLERERRRAIGLVALFSLVPLLIGLVLIRAGWRLTTFAQTSPRSRLFATRASAPPERIVVGAPEFKETRQISRSAWAAYEAHDPFAYRWPNGKVRFATKYAATKLLLLGFGSVFGFAPMMGSTLISKARRRMLVAGFGGCVAGATIGWVAWMTFAPSSVPAGLACAGLATLGLPFAGFFPSLRALRREGREQAVRSALERGEVPAIVRGEEAGAAADAIIEAGFGLLDNEAVRGAVRSSDGTTFPNALRPVFAQALAFRIAALRRPTIWLGSDPSELDGFDEALGDPMNVEPLRLIRRAEAALNGWAARPRSRSS